MTVDSGAPAALTTLLAFHQSIRSALTIFDETSSDSAKAKVLYEFFRGPMRWHDEDEGASLLPRLMKADRARVIGFVQACEAEHDSMESAVDDVIHNPRLLRLTAWELRRLIEPHLHREETEIFPLALELLSPQDFDDIAGEMHGRRVARWAPRAEKT